MGFTLLFHFSVADVAVILVKTRISFFAVMAYLRSYLNLNVIDLRINLHQIALRTKFILHFTVSIVVLGHNLVDFLMVLSIGALALLIPNNRDVSNTVRIVLWVKLVKIFKLILTLNLSGSKQVFKALVKVAGNKVWLFIHVLSLGVDVVIVRRLSAIVLRVDFAVALLRGHFVLHRFQVLLLVHFAHVCSLGIRSTRSISAYTDQRSKLGCNTSSAFYRLFASISVNRFVLSLGSRNSLKGRVACQFVGVN